MFPEIERQQRMGKEVAFRGDAAFAKPEVYEALKARGAAPPEKAGAGVPRTLSKPRWSQRAMQRSVRFLGLDRAR